MGIMSISTRFFGLNKVDVNNYLDSLIKEHYKILEGLEKELESLVKERDRLLAELADAKKEEIRYEDEVVEGEEKSSDQVISDAYKRLEKTVALINMIADEESAQLVQSANKKLEEYDKIIANLQEYINEKKKRIESLLSDVLGILKANIETVASKHGDRDKETPEKKLEKFEYIEKESAGIFEGEPLEKALEHFRSEKITADGTSLNSLPKLLMFQKKHAAKIDELKLAAGDESPDTDETDELLEEAGPDHKDGEAGQIGSRYEELFKMFDEDMAAELENQEQEQEHKPENPQSDDQNIKKMRNTLIIGKIAGEDILDSENNVIIPKGKVLTEEDVALAEKEAKLPELIINMHLPK